MCPQLRKGPPGNKGINDPPVSSVDAAKNWDVYPLTDPKQEHRYLDQRYQQLLVNGYVILPQFLHPCFVQVLRQQLEIAVEAIQPYTHSGIVTRDFVVRDVDKTSDYLFDVARSDQFADLAGVLLGKVAMPLHVDAVSGIPATLRSPRQTHYAYQAHFSDELGVTLWCQLTNTSTSIFVDFWPQSAPELLPHCGPKERHAGAHIVAGYGKDKLGTPRTIQLDQGDCLAYHSYSVHRLRGVMSAVDQHQTLLFNYRGSPYREQLHSPSMSR